MYSRVDIIFHHSNLWNCNAGFPPTFIVGTTKSTQLSSLDDLLQVPLISGSKSCRENLDKETWLRMAVHVKWGQNIACDKPKHLQWVSGTSMVAEMCYKYTVSLTIRGCDEVIPDKALVATQNFSSHRVPASDEQIPSFKQSLDC